MLQVLEILAVHNLAPVNITNIVRPKREIPSK